MNRTIRLAQLFEIKYGLRSEAASEDRRLTAVRQALLDAYNHYVNINSRELRAAYNILPLLAESGEKFSRQIIALMEDLINSVDLDPHELFAKIQNVLAVISELQEGKKIELRNSINDMFEVRRESDRNRREMAKSKFENVVFKKLASILEKQAKILNGLLGKSDSIMGGPSEPAVKEPSKQDQNFFRMTPTAVAYHLDDMNVFNEVWTNPEFKRRIIYLINSAKHRSGATDWYNDPMVATETANIMEAFKLQQSTNENYFNSSEETARELARPKFVSPELKNERLQQERLQEEIKTEEWEKLQEAVRQRDLAHQRQQEEQKKLDEEENLQSKYSSSRLTQIFKRYQ